MQTHNRLMEFESQKQGVISKIMDNFQGRIGFSTPDGRLPQYYQIQEYSSQFNSMQLKNLCDDNGI